MPAWYMTAMAYRSLRSAPRNFDENSVDKPPFDSPDLAENITGTSGVNLVYNKDGVEIYQICGK